MTVAFASQVQGGAGESVCLQQSPWNDFVTLLDERRVGGYLQKTGSTQGWLFVRNAERKNAFLHLRRLLLHPCHQPGQALGDHSTDWV